MDVVIHTYMNNFYFDSEETEANPVKTYLNYYYT
jgi:hypothetical protein